MYANISKVFLTGEEDNMTQSKKITKKVQAAALTSVMQSSPPKLRLTEGMRKAALASKKA